MPARRSQLPTLRDALRSTALSDPSRVALTVLDGPTVTYRELDDGSSRLAHALLGAGLSRGDRVAIWLANRVEYVETYLACLKAGLIIVQINVRHTAVEAEYQLRTSTPAAIVFDDTVAERLATIDYGFRLVVDVDSGYASLRESGRPAPLALPSEESTAVLGFTSGTTGHPKAAELTHGTLHAIGNSNVTASRYRDHSIQLFGFSLSFTSGIPAHVLPHLRVGGTTVLMPAWDTERLVHEIEARRATFTILPSPPILEFCEVAESRPGSLASLASVLHSTARAPESHLERLVGTIGSRLVEGWGMTENSGGLAAATIAHDYESSRSGILSSTGRAVPGTRIRLLDDDGNELAAGTTIGQLEIRSPALAKGYWRDAAATRASFHDGWYRTGDLGTIDGDGYVNLIDRRTDLIVSGGMNVYPSEVERVLAESPRIAQCCVVGVPHPRWGQVPVAFIVRADPALDEDAALAFARDRLAGYKLPTAITFVDELPTNASGKVLRNVLRDRAELAA